ncbi:MAG: cold shock domain-containing protein [Candidatus Bathyarchaeota archaeon]|nr:cold shock domain-containing protein [Candidatus Bathyarchaeota archaeon]
MRGFGFIEVDGEEDVFFHVTELSDDRIHESITLEGLSVTFVEETGHDGRTRAANVRLV